MKRKVTLILLMICLVLTAVSCGKKPAPAGAAATVKEAVANTRGLENVAAKMNMTLGLNFGGLDLDLPVKADIAIAGDKVHTDLSFSMLGQTVKTEIYQEDGWIYAVTGSNKTKSAAAGHEYDYADDLRNLVAELPDDVLAAAEIEQNKDGSITLEADVKGATFQALYGDFVKGLGTVTGMKITEITAGDGEVSVTVANGYVREYELSCDLKLVADGAETKMEVEVETTYQDPTAPVTVTPPEGYETFKEN